MKNWSIIIVSILLLVRCNGGDAEKKKKKEYYDGGSKKRFVYKNVGDSNIKKEYNYYKSGKVKSEIRYEDEELSGRQIRYLKNGNRRVLITYKNGKRHGKFIEYYSNGDIKIKGQYRSGKKVGMFILYYKNGEIQERRYFSDEGQLLHYRKFNREGTQITSDRSKHPIIVPVNGDTIKTGQEYKALISFGNMQYDSLEVAVVASDRDTINAYNILKKNNNKLPKVNDSLAVFQKIFQAPGKKSYGFIVYEIKKNNNTNNEDIQLNFKGITLDIYVSK